MPLHHTVTRYGWPARLLHWLTVLALVAQFIVGYLMEVDDDSGQGRGRGRGRGGESGRGRGRGRGGDDEESWPSLVDRLTDGQWDLVDLHVVLGLTIVAITILRLTWRRVDGLPPWAEGLSAPERRLAHWTERALYATLLLMPGTGLVLLSSGDDDLLWLHVGSHTIFFVAIAAHVGLVLKHQLVNRDRLLSRML